MDARKPAPRAGADPSPSSDEPQPSAARPSLPRDDQQSIRSAADNEPTPKESPTPSGLRARPVRRNEPPAPPAPHYSEMEFVGEGGMGIVYRAFDKRLDRAVAIKLLKVDDPTHARRFLNEARAQASISHENVCQVYEVGESEGVPFIAMQYIAGESLAQIGHQLPLKELVAVMRDTARAVGAAHDAGLVHRDLKPGNILLEALDRGGFKVYVLDFGLAREVGIRGETQTGEIVGTPTYMSPEQARGDWRLTDARSDVFSLGATLYEVLAGQPPITADHPWELLLKVTTADVTPLAEVKPGVPAELTTIVMKCLERERERRYPSAAALADDLQRFLEAKPIEAKDPSIGYLLWKKAKKHRLVVSLSAALLAAAMVLGAVWYKGRLDAARQARAADELGQAVKEMELFLRAAYGMPLHDVERERDVVRERLSQIAERTAEAGETGSGPGECALGQGYLALGDPAEARAHLTRSLAAGYASGALEQALGQALGELFRRALEDTKRIGSEDERKRKIAELETTLRDPALVHLRAAAGARTSSLAYTEGLIALYEGRNADAAAKARDAFDKAPWLYEAKKLEGDALFAEGSKYRHDAAFDYDKMDGYFRRADEAYRAAAEIGRSDPGVHLAECDLKEKAGWGAFNKMIPSDDAFAEADAACARAIAASSKDGRAVVQRALVLAARASTRRGVRDERAAEEAVAAARDAALAMPGEILARYAVARALSLHAQVLHDLGRDASMDEAIEAYDDVLAIDPRFTWALNEQGDALAFEAQREHDEGGDGSAEWHLAIARYEEAMSIDPKFALPVGGRLDALGTEVESDIESGRDAAAPLNALSSAADQLAKGGFGPWLAAFWTARARRLRAEHEHAFGRDPKPSLAEAEAAIKGFAGEDPGDYWFLEELAKCLLLEARVAVAGGDGAGAIDRARAAAKKAREKGDPESASPRLLSASIEVLALETQKDGPDTARAFDDTLSLLTPLWTHPGFGEPDVLGAELLALRAEKAISAGKNPDADIDRGLALADAALSHNPLLARALLVRGRLSLARARSARGPAQAEPARHAREAFEMAFRANPLLAKAHGDMLDAAKGLLR